jgi:hypothetical protein
METKLSSLLQKHVGLFSKEIKDKIKSGQFELNGDSIKEDITINLVKIHDAGSFLCEHVVNNELWYKRVKYLGLEPYFANHIPCDLSEHLFNFQLLKVSKKLFLVLETEDNEKDNNE